MGANGVARVSGEDERGSGQPLSSPGSRWMGDSAAAVAVSVHACNSAQEEDGDPLVGWA
jgi:hypothetical protein